MFSRKTQLRLRMGKWSGADKGTFSLSGFCEPGQGKRPFVRVPLSAPGLHYLIQPDVALDHEIADGIFDELCEGDYEICPNDGYSGEPE